MLKNDFLEFVTTVIGSQRNSHVHSSIFSITLILHILHNPCQNRKKKNAAASLDSFSTSYAIKSDDLLTRLTILQSRVLSDDKHRENHSKDREHPFFELPNLLNTEFYVHIVERDASRLLLELGSSG